MKIFLQITLLVLFQIQNSIADSGFNASAFLKESIENELVSITIAEKELIKLKKELNNFKIDLSNAQADPNFKKAKLKTNIAFLSTALTGSFVAKFAIRGIKERYLFDEEQGYMFLGTVLGVLPSSAFLVRFLTNLSHYDASILEAKIDTTLERIEKLNSFLIEKRLEIKKLKEDIK